MLLLGLSAKRVGGPDSTMKFPTSSSHGQSRSVSSTRAGFLVTAAPLLLLAACLAPQPGYEGSASEFGKLLAVDAQPVYGTEANSGAPLSGRDPRDLEVPSIAEIEPLLDAQEDSFEDSFEGAEQEINPYIQFGERIVVQDRADGVRFVSKIYQMPPTKADKVVELINALEPFSFALRPLPAAVPQAEGSTVSVTQRPPHDPDVVYYEILVGWDTETYTVLTAPEVAAPKPVILGDAIVVTATPYNLSEFESFIDLFGQVPQIELEAKIIEISEIDSTDIGIRSPDGLPIFQFGSMNFVRAFDFNLGNNVDPTESLLTLGAIQDGVTFNAIIEAVQSWQNVSIESRPKTVVRAGGVARLESTTRTPVLEVKSITDSGSFSTANTYIDTGVKLYIAPRIVGAHTLALDVQLEGSQTVGFQATFTPSAGNAIQAPIIATRSAKSLVYMEPGQTLLIGGLTQESTIRSQSKVPILGDIPLIGFFFRNHSDRVERQHVIFAISPRIVQRGDMAINF